MLVILDFENTPRLLKYIQESDPSIGYISELSFGCDGRVVCSPYGGGVRLLAFDEHLSHMHSNVDCPSEFSTLHFGEYQSGTVLCSKFANTKNLIGSGTLEGDLQFYQPQL